MGKVTRKIESMLSGLPQRLYLTKIRYSEEIAIRKKRSLFSSVVWSDAQKKEFDAFWKAHYGKKIKPWWHQLYESMNGVYHYDYFPEMLFSTRLEPLLNPPEYCRMFSDKSLTETIYRSVPGVAFPETILINCNGAMQSKDRTLLSRENALALLADAGPCILKPTVETGSGKGVKLLELKGGADITSGLPVSELLKADAKNYIIQKRVRNNKALSELYPFSLNTFRVITYLAGEEIHCTPSALRIGTGKNQVDNIHLGGLVVGVQPNGLLREDAYQLGYGDKKTVFKQHPDTGVTFRDYSIGDFPRVLNVAKQLHAVTPHLGMISWDLTLDENENVVLIEANCQGQSIWFPQIVSAEPAFGNHTNYFLNQIKK